jgi:hypothetical protein
MDEKHNRQKRAKGTKTLGIVVLAGVAVFGLLVAVGSQLPSDERWSYTADLFAENNLREQLNDPDSAQFKDVKTYASDSEDARWVCGFVNWKGKYGGYGGFRRFVSKVTVIDRHHMTDGRGGISANVHNVALDGGPWEIPDAWARYCHGPRDPLPDPPGNKERVEANPAYKAPGHR